MEKLKIQGKNRDPKTASVATLKKAGEIPGVLYGHHIKNQPLAIKTVDFEKAFRTAGESTIVDLQTDDGKNHPVIIQDVQFDPVTSRPLHVDFYEVSMTEKLKAEIALEFIGESKAIKELGGVLVKVISQVEVECLPADLPHNIEVDISAMKAFGDSITVANLKVSPKVKILTLSEEVVAKVQQPRNIEAELAAEKQVEDVSTVVGAAEEKPVEVVAEEGKKEKEEK